jgi:hypothetical protein
MLIKINLILKKESPAHLPIARFIELIKNDKILQPTTKVLLESLKKAHQNYVPLPLEHCVILSSRKGVTLHRDTQPEAKVWTSEPWTAENKKEYTKDKVAFLAKILKTYENMGYTYIVLETDLKEVNKILSDLETLAAKVKKRLGRLGL